MDKQEMTAERIQTEYQKGVSYNQGLNLYDDVKICERFYEGRQWEGVKTKQVRPLAEYHPPNHQLQGGTDCERRCGAGD